MDKKRIFTKPVWATFSVALITIFVLAACNRAMHTPLLSPQRKDQLVTQQLSIAKLPIDDSYFQTDTAGFPTSKVPDDFKMRVNTPHIYTNIPLEQFQLPASPKNTSEQTKKELEYLLEIQKHRSLTQLIRSWHLAYFRFNPSLDPHSKEYEQQKKYLFYVGSSLGDWYSHKNLPATTALLSNVWIDFTAYVWQLKFKYNRTRPYLLDKHIHNRQTTNWPAYPSGHASFSYMCAYLMSEVLPEKKEVFLNDAFEISHSREVLGVHFPSDNEAGRLLAAFYVKELFNSEKFRADFELARKEILEYQSE